MKSALEEYLTTITGDDSMSIESRIDEVMALRRGDKIEDDDDGSKEYERLSDNAFIYSALIDMLRDKDKNHEYETEQMQLLVLLAENLDDQRCYRPMQMVADYSLDLLRNELLPLELLQQAIPRLSRALSESVYRHRLYDILLRHLRLLQQGGCLDQSAKEVAENFLRLHLILEDNDKDSYLLKRDLKQGLASLFSPEELMDIIMHPEKGLRNDPVEYTRRWEDIYYDVEDALEERFANAPRQMGFCFHFWSAKAELLKDKYNISWRSPAQMNPHVMFD